MIQLPHVERPVPMQPIPAHAQRVFAGAVFEVWQWQQQLFDGTSATFEVIRKPDGVIVIPVTSQGTIILVDETQPGHGSWTGLPAGGIDTKEDPAHAALRELQEETGYVPSDLELLQAHEPGHRTDYALYVFIARGCQILSAPHQDGGEKITVRQVSFEQFITEASELDFRHENLSALVLRARLKEGGIAHLRQLLLGTTHA